ncbi:MAG: hypothetical protein EOP82_27200 [Variovorax sp.]|nr:MAG: hypothetical protein EOP82_27200 [Variovorax sp.]
MDLSGFQGEASVSADTPAYQMDTPATDRLFHQLVTDHRTRLQRFFLRHIGHHDDAADIAQQAVMEAARSFERSCRRTVP